MSPQDETRQRILEAASQVFAEKGYEGATTRAIAAVAGVNEVTLFRHFGSKKSLLMAAIDQDSALAGLRSALEGQMTGECRQDLAKLGRHFLGTLLKRRKEILMSLCTAERLPEVREVISQAPLQQRQMLAGYLRGQIERGVVREMDPELAAQAFLGMLFAFAINQGLLAGTLLARLPVEAVVEQFVDIFVNGTLEEE
ncbi:MAG: TetR/AcrR family transcriptional regulator [Thermoflexales bacterium]|nr:TetR/AcrR family transcriptional regulator [Thermoflexales bacterium]